MSEVGLGGVGQHFTNTPFKQKRYTALELSHKLNTKFISHGVIAEATAFPRRIFLEPFVLLIET